MNASGCSNNMGTPVGVRIARFAREEQLTNDAAAFTPRVHHQRAKGIDQTPRVAARRGDRQRQSDYACRTADCVPYQVLKWLSAEAVQIRCLRVEIRRQA